MYVFSLRSAETLRSASHVVMGRTAKIDSKFVMLGKRSLLIVLRVLAIVLGKAPNFSFFNSSFVTSFGNMNHIASTIILGFLLSAESMSPWLQSAV